ncbi:MAG: FkbM family methyltransferase [Planctomycetota bacterium]
MSVGAWLGSAVAGAYRAASPTQRGGYRVARLARGLRGKGNWRGAFDTPGGRMTLDLGVYPDVAMAFGLYELATERLIRSVLRPGDVFVDGGANVGYFTLLAAKCVGARGRVEAFEPQPGNRARLEAHLADNGVADRVTVHAAALVDEAKEVAIHFAAESGNHGSSTIFAGGDSGDPGGGAAGGVSVRGVRMDEAVALGEGAGPVRLVKLDVEGAEHLAAAGMAGLVGGDDPPMVVGEFNRRMAERAGVSAERWVAVLRELQPRYRVRWVGGRSGVLSDGLDELSGEAEANLLLRAE